jgi:hypothetical protein
VKNDVTHGRFGKVFRNMEVWCFSNMHSLVVWNMFPIVGMMIQSD